jgi:hypothetical protein
MSTIGININLRQFKHAITTTAKGVKCIIIPIKENNLVEGEKGVYFNATGFEIKKSAEGQKQTHLVKQSFPKEKYEAMSDEEKNAQPIFGNLTVWQGHAEPEPQTMNDPDYSNVAQTDDLPF